MTVGLEFLRTLYTEIVILGTRVELPLMCSYNTNGFQSTNAFIGYKNTVEDLSRPNPGAHPASNPMGTGDCSPGSKTGKA
jgi:hypothetical protein